MQTSKKPKEVSARVVLTIMPEDGVDQFNFMKPMGATSANKVEALLQFHDHVEVKDLFSCLNKLLGAYLISGAQDISSEDAVAIEHTYHYILNMWRAETDEFEQMHQSFLAG